MVTEDRGLEGTEGYRGTRDRGVQGISEFCFTKSRGIPQNSVEFRAIP
jgi:hypothetical protein